jgi:hypothetical protein
MTARKRKKKKYRMFWFLAKMQLVLLFAVIAGACWYYFGGYAEEVKDLKTQAVELVRYSNKETFKANQTSIVYASDESHLQFVDTVSVKAAIRLNDYFEDSYVRIRSFMANDTCEEPPKVLLSLLPDTFDTKTAIAIGKELQGISERTVMNYLKELCHSRLLRKAKAGHYEKIVYESGKYSMNENE